MSSEYYNPYSGKSFFAFWIELFSRLASFATGNLPISNLATDEIQIIVLAGIAVSAALVGSFLVLRRMTMLANSLSHTILLGIVGAYLLTRDGLLSDTQGHTQSIHINALLLAALIMGLVTSFLTEFLTKTIRLQEDASTGIVFTSLFALGIILLTLFTRNAHIGTEVVMGNVDALHLDDCKLILVIMGINIFLTAFFFKEYAITSFDPGLARALGFSTLFFNYLLMTQVSITCIGAFRAVGVLMVLAFLTGPPLMARMLTDSLHKMLWIAIGIGCLAAVTGVAISRHMLSVYDMPLSTAGIVVCTIVAFFIIVMFVSPSQGFIAKWRNARNLT